jgi:TetR/AcrR family transcriptional regulator
VANPELTDRLITMQRTHHVIAKALPGRRPRASVTGPGTQAEILNAARTVFARKGYDGATTREMADLAHVNTAMIYYHFTDKDQLYRAVLADSFSAFEKVWEHGIFRSAAPAKRKIRKFIEEFIRFQHANEELRKIMSMEFAICSRNYTWIADTYFVHSYSRLASILRDGVRSGELRKCDPSLTIPSIVGMIIHCFIMRPIAEHITGKEMDLAVGRFGKFVTDLIFDGLRPRCS